MNRTATVNRDSKDVLAKVLATENLRIIHSPKARTASFHTGTRVLTLPVYDGKLSNAATNMFIGHEVGHALQSPGEKPIMAALNAIEPNKALHKNAMDYLNVVEDVRIERYIKNRYPGLVPQFKEGYNDLIARDFFKIRGVDINTLPLIDRINLFFKAGSALPGIQFSDAERAILTEIQNASTWSQVVDAADALYKMAKEQSQTQQSNDPESGDGESDENQPGSGEGQSGEGSEDDESSDDSDASGDSQDSNEDSGKNKSKGSGEDESDGDDTSGSSDSSKGSDSKSKNSGKSSSGKDAGDGDGDGEGEGSGSPKSGKPKSGKSAGKAPGSGAGTKYVAGGVAPGAATQAAFEQSREAAVDTTTQEMDYIQFPNVDLGTTVVPFKDIRAIFRKIWRNNVPAEVVSAFAEFKKDNQNKVNYLVMEFNRRKAAAERQREVVSRTGMISTSRLYAYKFADDIFKSNVSLPTGKSHALVYFVDFSGSMSGNIQETVEQLLCLAMFCRATGIPMEIYTFGHTGSSRKTNKTVYRQNDIRLSNCFSLLQLLSSKSTAQEFKDAFYYLFSIGMFYGSNWVSSRPEIPGDVQLGGWTPIADAAMCAPKIVERMREIHKTEFTHIVFLTDGNGAEYYYVERTGGFTGYANVHHGLSKNTIITDPVTKVEFSGRDGSFTDVCLKYAAARSKSNVIGFFCTGGTIQTTASVAAAKSGNSTRNFVAELNKNNFVMLDNKGYTEYYLIPGGKSLSTSKKVSYENSLSEEEVQRKMMENEVGRKKDRVLLSRFIDKIQRTL